MDCLRALAMISTSSTSPIPNFTAIFVVVDVLVPGLEHADQRETCEERRPDTVAHCAVDLLLLVLRLHQQTPDQGCEAEDVDHQQDLAGSVHG